MSGNVSAATAGTSSTMSKSSAYAVLIAGFLGWMFAGFQLAITPLAMRVAVQDLFADANVTEGLLGKWAGWLNAVFLFGAAAGGYVFGWVGDRFGRKMGMALSITCYCVFSGVTYFVQDEWQLMILRFVTCLGVGGMWPNGIALMSEAWPGMSRPFLAGLIGTAANVGIVLFSALAAYVHYISRDDWRWTMIVGALPLPLVAYVWWAVPESPSWLRRRQERRSPGAGGQSSPAASSLLAVFLPPHLQVTVLGILLGMVPLFGAWGGSYWGTIWADKAGQAKQTPTAQSAKASTLTGATAAGGAAGQNSAPASPPRKDDPGLKAKVLLARSLPGSIGSLIGGSVAAWFGRRLSYFLMSLLSLISAQCLFRLYTPLDQEFMHASIALGFFSGLFFGWLPLCLPELFPTAIRSTGAGVSFNFGRILTAFGVLLGSVLLEKVYHGDYAQVGQATTFIYAVGMVLVFFVPDTSRANLED